MLLLTCLLALQCIQSVDALMHNDEQDQYSAFDDYWRASKILTFEERQKPIVNSEFTSRFVTQGNTQLIIEQGNDRLFKVEITKKFNFGKVALSSPFIEIVSNKLLIKLQESTIYCQLLAFEEEENQVAVYTKKKQQLAQYITKYKKRWAWGLFKSKPKIVTGYPVPLVE